MKKVENSKLSENTRGKYGCHVCSKSFFHASALQVHVLLHTSTLPRRKAEKIEKENEDVDFERFNRDRPIRSREPIAPTKQNSQFFHRFELNLTNLDENMKKKTENTKVYACSMCGKGFNKKTSMRIHQTKRHVHTREFLIFV